MRLESRACSGCWPKAPAGPCAGTAERPRAGLVQAACSARAAGEQGNQWHARVRTGARAAASDWVKPDKAAGWSTSTAALTLVLEHVLQAGRGSCADAVWSHHQEEGPDLPVAELPPHHLGLDLVIQHLRHSQGRALATRRGRGLSAAVVSASAASLHGDSGH